MSDPAEWGPEFLINTETFVSQFGAEVVVLPNGQFAAVWNDNSQFFDEGGYESLRLQIFNTDGSKFGDEVIIKEGVSGTQSFPQITVLSDGRILVAHDTSELVGRSIRVQVFNSDGTAATGEMTIDVSSNSPTNVIVAALPNGNAVLTWEDPFSGIRAQVINVDGSNVGNEVLVTSRNGARDPDIMVLSDGRFLVSWADDSQSDGDASGFAVRAKFYDQDGLSLGAPFLVNTLTDTSQGQPSLVALAGGGFVAVWHDGAFNSGDSNADGISAQIFDANGAKIGGQFSVNTTQNDRQEIPQVAALPDGGFVVAWHDYSTQTIDNPFVVSIKAQVFSSDGRKIGDEFEVASNAFYAHGSLSVAALPDGRFVVTWDDDRQTAEDPSFLASYAQIFDPRTSAVDVVGSSTDEQLAGTVFDDTVSGAGGKDQVFGGLGNDILNGGTGNDGLFGGDGDDELNGGDDDDILSGGQGGDTLSGGSGNDGASYENAPGPVRAHLSQPIDNAGDAAGDSYSSIENLIGSLFDDELSGDAGNNVLSGLAGDDTVRGGLGDDTLDGGDGIDTATYHSSALGGVTVDLTVSGPQNTGSAGSDTLISIENVSGTDFQDTLSGDTGDNVIEGFAEADTLDGGNGIDTLSYAASSAAVTVNLLTSQVSGGHGTGDTFLNFENLMGSALDDSLSGDGIDNVLAGGAGADALDGGDGLDTASYVTALAGVIADLGDSAANSGDALGDTYVSIENLEGSLFGDLLIGSAGVNRIEGLFGDDIIEGGAGADNLDGGAGFDALSYLGSAAAVTVNLGLLTSSGGDADGDIFANFEDLIGSQHDDTLIGDDGQNVLEGGAGADVLDGGVGSDAVSYLTSESAVSVNLETGETAGADAVGDSFISIENVVGSTFSDTLIAPDDISVVHGLFGADGNDELFAGFFGNDQLFGGNGDDLLTGGFAGDLLDGGRGNDTLIGGSGTDALIGGDGDDTVIAGSHFDTIVGGAGDDTYDGGSGFDTVTYASTTLGVFLDFFAGTASGTETGNDILVNIEEAIGGAGADDFAGDNADNTLSGGAGIDTLRGLGGADTLNGGEDGDFLFGQDGNDEVFGGGGDDTASGGSGRDIVHGGFGNDILTGEDGFDTLNGGAGNDELYGGADGDTMTGGDGDDTVDGGAGDDTIVAGSGAGNDAYDGGADTDTITYESTWQGVTVNLVTGTANGAEIDNDTLANIENVIGGAGADVITGNGSANRLEGRGGSDTLVATGGNGNVLRGGSGDDILMGGFGNDVQLQGNAGADSFSGGTGADDFYIDAQDIFFDGGGGYDRILVIDTSGVNISLAGTNVERVIGDAGNDTVDATGVAGAVLISGVDGNDTLTGGDTADQLDGGAGNDILTGGDGGDFLFGGAGADSFNGGSGDDRFFADSTDLSFAGGTGFDRLFVQDTLDFTLSLAGTDIERVNGNDGNDVLSAAGVATGVTLAGVNGNDTLTGGGGNDLLAGGAGTDMIEGGAGSDSLFGGADADTFIFNTGSGFDFIADWNDGLDMIDFSGNAGVNAITDLTITDNGSNVRLEFGGDTIVMIGATGQIEVSDFLFV